MLLCFMQTSITVFTKISCASHRLHEDAIRFGHPSNNKNFHIQSVSGGMCHTSAE
jgi:hypothetical protein